MTCDRCAALMINGVFCHELGCPRRNSLYTGGRWVKFVKCFNCGCDVEENTCCDCQEDYSLDDSVHVDMETGEVTYTW